MFNWQFEPGGDGEGVVSHRFWMYWATAVPLTVVTLIGWASWWIWEMYTFDKTFTQVVGEKSEVVERVQHFKRLRRMWLGVKSRSRSGSLASVNGSVMRQSKHAATV